MSRSGIKFILWITAFALIGAGAFLFAGMAQALGRRQKPPEIVHGHRAFEKPYRSPYVAENWQILETKIEDDLTTIWAVDQDHAWAAGISGGLYRTADGGVTWKPLVGVDYARFEQLVWKSSSRGFALTKEGQILRTDNGGDAWRTLRHRADGRVRRIDFFDSDRGWAVGERGLILHTSDGGDTWVRQRAEGAGDLTSIQMLSAETGWTGGPDTLFGTRRGGEQWSPLARPGAWRFVSGRRGYANDGHVIYMSKDGGNSWRRVRSAQELIAGTKDGGKAEDPFITDLSFVDRYNGLAAVVNGGFQLLFRTRSLGRVWKLVYDASDDRTDELVRFSMSDGKNGLAIDSRGNLRATGDGARTWPVQLRGEYFDLRDVHFADRNSGWAAGGTGRILVTEDGGSTWREAARQIDGGMRVVRTAMLPSGRPRAWVAGDGGRVAASSREGRPWRSPWRVQSTPTRETLRDLDFLDAQRGAAVGGAGFLIMTEDGGAQWRRVGTGTAESLRAIAYIDHSLILAAGGREVLLSRNGGLTFSQVAPRRFLGAGTVVSADAPDARHLFVLQEEGFLLRSADGGKTWDRRRVGDAERLLKVQFVDLSRGWILGRARAGGSVLFTTGDGGDSWEEVALPGVEARSLHFADPETGWLVASQAILHSVDGGRNWRRQRLAPSRFFRDFVFLPRGGAWAVGDNGFAARYVSPK